MRSIPEVQRTLHRLLIALLCVAGFLPVSSAARAQDGRAPNIVFILADDLGWRDTSLYGTPYAPTPNIARLARRGMRFSNAYSANPLCSPTRASILTGLYPARLGITAPHGHLPEVRLTPALQPTAPPTQKALSYLSVTRLKTEYPTLARSLKAAGYTTGHFGKWHLGAEPYSALQHGFDVDVPHYPGPGPAGSYLAPWRFPPTMKFRPRTPTEHIEDRMADEAVQFIRANKSRPFFLNYWAFSVHAPYDAKDEVVEKYRAVRDEKSPRRNPVYAAMVQSLDEAVGKLLDTLDREGLAENTIIVFFSDNGGVHWAKHGPNRFPEMADTPPTSNAPLRGGKATLYEGGTRVPCVVVWPGKVKADTQSEVLLSSVDWYPTLLEMARVPTPATSPLDGVSQVPALLGTGSPRREVFVFFPHTIPATGAIPATWVRQGDWKLIRFHADGDGGADRLELYNLKDDLGESENLASRYPERVRELNTRISRFLTETGALIPRPNPDYGKPAKTPSSEAVGGWSPRHAVTLTVNDGGELVVTATGSDPYLTTQFPPIPPGPLRVEMRFKASAVGKGQIFWQEAGESPAFAPGRSQPFAVAHDGQWHEVTVSFTPKKRVTGLRLDPVEGIGQVVLAYIRILDEDGKVIREWKWDGKKS